MGKKATKKSSAEATIKTIRRKETTYGWGKMLNHSSYMSSAKSELDTSS